MQSFFSHRLAGGSTCYFVYFYTHISNFPKIAQIVYRLRTKHLRFVAPMPEQVGTTTMHLAEVPGETCQKFTSPNLGEMDQIDAFQNPMLSQ